MTEIEKMQKYIERTKLENGGRYKIGLREAYELARQTRNLDGPPIEIIDLAFNYGKAKGYRAAKAERRAAV